jgi:ATP-dependent Lon protease
VGKTSLAQSIARSLGRNFARISLGGLHDEAEIRGHRSTYIGSMPGRFIQAMKRAGSMNPVILVDEIDKVGRDHRGDPASAMLEVLDPEQNSSFHDNYLNIPFDLSKVLFVVTANTLDTIPAPLRDRMEVIHLSGYALEEKVRIAEQYLVKKGNQDAGLATPLPFSSELLADIIQSYTREAGVRELERLIRKVCAKGARALVEENAAVTLDASSIEKYLGPRVFQDDAVSEITLNQVGVANGLAWTSVGGELLKIEAMVMPGKGKLILTGSLGNVMQESARAAVSYARAHAQQFGIASTMFTDYDLHVHVPSGGVPKDGPSAGIALLSAVLSAYTGRKIDGSYAMTGELNLRGNVMPIGGVKEKVLAAKRNGISHVLLPKKNKKDYVIIDEEITRGIEVIWVSHADEVLDRVLMAR